MDHSPSEQLSNDPDDWHTTVIVLSEGGEHWHLASDIAGQMMLKDNTLKKWSGRRTATYKGKFERALFERASTYPAHIVAISTQARTIRNSYDHMLSELGLDKLVKNVPGSQRPKLEFGPFQQVSASKADQGDTRVIEPLFFEISGRQGVFLVYLCHFIFRMHRHLLTLIQRIRPEIKWIDWQLMPDKFPNEFEGSYFKLFNVIMSGATHAKLVSGNIRVMTFTEKDADQGSQLADNIAGFLSEKVRADEVKLDFITPETDASSFLWEIWKPQTEFSQEGT